VPPGYVLYRNAWLGGVAGSISRPMSNFNVTGLAANCSADPYCVAFDTPAGPYTRYFAKAPAYWEVMNGSLTFIKTGVTPGALAPPQVQRGLVNGGGREAWRGPHARGPVAPLPSCPRTAAPAPPRSPATGLCR
jgi:hypothetical protein